jgi:hypothetical protein
VSVLMMAAAPGPFKRRIAASSAAFSRVSSAS